MDQPNEPAGPNPKIHRDDLEAVIERAARMKQDADGYLDDGAVDEIADSLGLSETLLAQAHAQLQQERRKKPIRWPLLGLGCGVLAVALAGALTWSRPETAPTALTVPVERVAPTATSGRMPVAPLEATIPWRVSESAESAGLQPTLRLSAANQYSPTVRVAGKVVHNGTQAITKLRLQLELVDKAGQVVGVETMPLIESYQAPLYPGDSCLFAKPYLSASGPVDHIRLRFMARQDEAPKAISARPIPLQWAVAKPAGVDLAVEERRLHLGAYFSDEAYATIEATVQQQGPLPISHLKMEMRYFDKANRLLAAKPDILVYSGNGQLLQGDRIRENWMERLPKRFDHYELHVLECR